MHKILVLIVLIILPAAPIAHAHGDEGPDFNHGIQIIGKVLRHFINSQPEDIKVAEGVHLVSSSNPNDATARSADDNTFFGAVEHYLQTHEVKIKFSELLPSGQDLGRSLKDAFNAVDSSDIESGRGKKGGMGGGLLMLGGMFGSMMGALGIGGVGLLAMKALTVSAMALLLAAVIGLKKLASSGHDSGGSHRVIHASSHGHDRRRKREAADMAYKAWSPSS